MLQDEQWQAMSADNKLLQGEMRTLPAIILHPSIDLESLATIVTGKECFRNEKNMHTSEYWSETGFESYSNLTKWLSTHSGYDTML